MKLLINILVFIVALTALAMPVMAKSSQGEIIDILADGVITIQFKRGHGLKSGDATKINYLAGSLPMVIGEYEVVTSAGKVCLLKPVALTMQPSKGMTVDAALVKENSSTIIKKRTRAPNNYKSPPLQSSLAKSSLAKSSTATEGEIDGKVIEVMGDDIKVAINGHGSPRIGWFVDLFYVTPSGKELPVGTWKVKSIAGKTVVATKFKGVGNANKLLKAVIYKQKIKAPVVSRGVPAPKNIKPKPTSRPLPAVRPEPQQSIQLLGQTAPAKKVVKSPVVKPSTLPPGVKKKTPKKVKKRSSKPLDPVTTKLLKFLKSSDYKSKRTATKLIAKRSNPADNNPILYETINKELLKGYKTAKAKLEVDALAWMCKALAVSKNSKYKETLKSVAKGAGSRKLKKHAQKSLRALK